MQLVDVFVFRQTVTGPEFLLLKRSADEEYPNIWQCVSGGIQAGEKAWQAAIREMVEETGYQQPTRCFVADYAYNLYLHPTDKMLSVPVFGAEVSAQDHSAPMLSTEHSEYRWCSPETALKLLSWENYRLGLRAVLRIMNTPDALRIAQIPIQ